MVKDTYQFPTTLEKASAPDTHLEHASGEPTYASGMEGTTSHPERLKPYASIVRMGEQIRSYREAALEEERLKHDVSNWLTGSALKTIRMQRSKRSLADLINAEAIEGGKLFDKEGGHLFVLDDRNIIVEQQYGGTVLDFVYAKLDPKTKQTQYAIVYRVTDTSIDKIYNGRAQQLSVAELQHLMKVIEAYRLMIRDKFYPIDAFLEDPDEDEGDGATAATARALTSLHKLSEQAITKL